ncbi:diguanylate cyclase [Erythrobacter sp. THAF29]|uniref:GGDEF domain-containing protein n=1 Tax=Erythrobacter sp. THAF29 TaxID=2587851 RepID=UPI001268CBF5|nr:GGDEF domain-containing protein [Erythrobacter sp. THAF29]QFT77322.1 putative diguanylate cyclase YcdT [Erythrobacter sp. THAF29]
MSDQVLGLITPGMSFIFAIAGLVLWLRNRDAVHLLGFAVAPTLIGLSFTVNHYASAPNAVEIRILVGFLSMSAVITMAWAACNRMGQRAPLAIWIAGALATACVLLVSDPARDVSVWLFALNGFCGIVFVMAAQIMARSGSCEFADRALVFVISLIAIQFFIRPIGVVLYTGPMNSVEYRESVGHAVLMASSAILMLILVATIIVALVTDQLRTIHDDANSDPLTGLPGRRAFEEKVGQALSEGEDDCVPTCLIVADIDHFKQVNDLWGHQAGDRAIGSFGKLISRTIRQSDIAGRIGGEEFSLLVSNCTQSQAARLAERLRKSFAALQHEGINADIRLTASFGVTAIHGGEGYARAFSRADRALYEAKEAGRDRVVVAESGRKSGAGAAEQQARANAA